MFFSCVVLAIVHDEWKRRATLGREVGREPHHECHYPANSKAEKQVMFCRVLGTLEIKSRIPFGSPCSVSLAVQVPRLGTAQQHLVLWPVWHQWVPTAGNWAEKVLPLLGHSQ